MSISNQTLAQPPRSFRRLKRPNLVEDVVTQVRNGIVAGKWKPGDPIASEGDLCKDMGVSRTVIREAMWILRSQGLVEVSQGKCPYVKHADSAPVVELMGTYLKRQDHSLLDLIAARRPLETEIASLAALHAKPPQIKVMQEILDSVTSDSSLEENMEADRAFHVALAEASGNPFFPLLLESLTSVMQHFFQESQNKIDLKQIERGQVAVYGPVLMLVKEDLERAKLWHTEILNAVRNGDSEGARKAMNEHLNVAENDLCGESVRKQFRVVIIDFIADDLSPEKEILGELADVEAFNAHNEEGLSGRIEDVDAIMLYHSVPLTPKTIGQLEKCKLIVRCGVGCDNVDLVAAAKHGIPVANVPDYGTEEVADSAIGLTLALTRGITFLNSRLRDNLGPWSYQQVTPLQRLRNQVFGIVGLGRIGTAVAIRAKALGMKVLFYDPYKPDGYDKSLGIQKADSLEELLRQSYVLSLHCPLTEETKNLIDGRAISLMPAGSYIVNTARGGIIDVAAIPAAIELEHLAGVGLDVFVHEPPEVFHPLITAWRNPDHLAYHRVLINPHSAFYSEAGLLDMRTKGAKACQQALLGKPISTIVNYIPATQEPPNGKDNRSLTSARTRAAEFSV